MTMLDSVLDAPMRKPLRILIADDDVNCRALLLIGLAAPGTELAVATDGGELLDAIAEHGPFDLIVTDIDMPWMQGLQVLASLRAAELTTPVVVVTGLTRPDLPAAVARLGRTRLLRKPFTICDLRAAIAELRSDHGNSSPAFPSRAASR